MANRCSASGQNPFTFDRIRQMTQLATRADVVIRAHEIARDLSDHERIALGVTLIGTAQHPRNWAALRAAQQMVHEQADEFLQLALSDTGTVAAYLPNQATTHEQLVGHSPRTDPSRPVRGTIGKWAGDIVGCLSLFATLWLGLVIGWAVQ